MYSCSSSERKELLARLGWRGIAQALDDTALVVTLTKFRRRAPQFLHVLEYLDPQQLFFQRANEPFNATVTFRLTHERWGRLHAQEGDFSLLVVVHVLTTVIVPVTDARSRPGAETAAVIAHSLPQWFQSVEACGFIGRMQAHIFRGAVIHRDEHHHLAFLDGGRHGVVAGPDFVRLRGDDRARMRILGLAKRA